jgi:hypothetical protein
VTLSFRSSIQSSFDPVQLLRAGDVAGVVEEDVLVGLEQLHLGIIEMRLDPRGRDEDLWMRVPALLDRLRIGHGSSGWGRSGLRGAAIPEGEQGVPAAL